jgi:hypothetical protein
MRKLLLLSILLPSIGFGASSGLGPQSDPGLVFKQVPSAAQWNSYFSSKLDYNANGLPIALGGTGARTKQQALINLGITSTQSPNLLSLAGITGAANKVPYFTGVGVLDSAVVSGDCTNAAMAFTCTKTGGVSFAASATTDTTSAANISSGVLTAARGGTGISNAKTLAVNANLTLAGTDGSTLNVGTGGTLASGAFSGTYTLPVATSALLGGVKPDGSSITVDAAGVIAAPGMGGGTVGVGTANALAYYPTASTTVGPLTTANNGALITSGAGVPSISSTLPAAVQANITGLGNVLSGGWYGSVISPTYGGTGVNNGAKSLTLGASLVTTGTGAQTLNFPAAAYTYSFPATSDTVGLISATQTLTNKTISGSSNTLSNIAFSSLATAGASTIIGNATGSGASPTELSVPACSDPNNALAWTGGTGFLCRVIDTFIGSTNSQAIRITNATEPVNVVASAPPATTNFYLSNGAVQYYTTTAANNFTLNLAWSTGSSMNSVISVGDSVTFVLVTTQGATAYRPTAFTIDGSAITPKWLGGTAPVSGNASGNDVYSCTIIKTASATYNVLCAQSQYK